jgi:glycosyltransferase involved in cell wall biosynthesis
MATYNRAHFILETLQSIQNQTYKNWECIIIDDGGTDNTAEVILPIIEQDSRFMFIKRSDTYLKGLPGCRNYGIDLSKGEFIIFFDDDDIVHPQNLELCIFEFSNKTVSFCRYVTDVFFDKFNYNFDYSKIYTSFNIDINDLEKMLTYELHIKSCDVMWKKECFIKNRFVENIVYCEDWELYSRIVSSGIMGISIDKCLYFGRKHPNSMTGEFYGNDPIRRESYSEAILLVVRNLKEKQLLSYSLLRYFVQISLNFKEFNLFPKMLKILEISEYKKLKWQVIYYILPARLWLYAIWKMFKKI